MVTGFIMSILDSYKNVLKSTPIVDILAAFGKDDRFNRSGLFFSPFRDEKAPSFHWNRNANVWYDHGSGEGGDAIVLVQKLAGCSYSESLKILASLNPNVSFHLDVDETRQDRRAVRVNASGTLFGYVNHSGGAKGADTEWGEAGARYGVRSMHYWYGKRTSNGNSEVSEQDFNEGWEKVLLANETLHRRPDKFKNLLSRNWMQVREAEAVFAVSSIDDGFNPVHSGGHVFHPVSGGTGWACQMAIDAGKPLYVFDQKKEAWFSFTGNGGDDIPGWHRLGEPPVLTRSFAGIGSRDLTPAGRQAIGDCYLATLRHVQGLDAASSSLDAAPEGPRFYDGLIEPSDNVVFVFGSNPEGRHGAGAAKVARERFGAVYGQGEGLQGNAYAIPTKDLRVTENRGLRSIGPEAIKESIRKMYGVARENPLKSFMVAYTNGPDETSLNGYTGREMCGMFMDAGPIPGNVVFSSAWKEMMNPGKQLWRGDRTVDIWAASGENASLSNMALQPFDEGGVTFRSVEQYFQFKKAVFAGDDETAEKILAAESPYDAKRLGREVRGLDSAAWDAVSEGIMKYGNKLRFLSNDDAMDALLATGEARLTHDNEKGKWREAFPRILMELREEFRSKLLLEDGESVSTAEITITGVSESFSFNKNIEYMTSKRQIPLEVLEANCQEVEYSVSREGEEALVRKAVGFRNHSGEWVLRIPPYMGKDGVLNNGLKRTTGNDYSLVVADGRNIREGDAFEANRSALVFEGFTDYLSWLAWNERVRPEVADVIVLNSVNNTDRAIEAIKGYPNVVTYLDNDKAGRSATEKIRNAVKDAGHSFWDCSKFFEGYDDLNEKWCDVSRQRKERLQHQEGQNEDEHPGRGRGIK